MSIFLKKVSAKGFLKKRLGFLFYKNGKIFFLKPGKFLIEIL